jgi:hypothetical protein
VENILVVYMSDWMYNSMEDIKHKLGSDYEFRRWLSVTLIEAIHDYNVMIQIEEDGKELDNAER